MASLKCADDLKKLILNTCYPIGHIWVSMNSTNPKDIVGGEWTQIKGVYLCAVDPNTTMPHKDVLKKFGSWDTNDTTLSLDQMPYHNHEFIHSVGNTFGFSMHTSETNHGKLSTAVYQGLAANVKEDYISLSNVGGSKGHRHQFSPPSIATYMWYRTA